MRPLSLSLSLSLSLFLASAGETEVDRANSFSSRQQGVIAAHYAGSHHESWD